MTAPSRPSNHESDDRRVAADGQHIVDQRVERRDERREIEHNSERVMTASREERARDPSISSSGSRRLQVGPILALLAGLFTLAIRTWPIATPQGRGMVGSAWFICATIAGGLYLAGFFLSDRHWRRARMILVSAAVLHLVVGVLAATLVDTQDIAAAWQSLLFDAVPAIVALIAAFLIAPPPGERGAHA